MSYKIEFQGEGKDQVIRISNESNGSYVEIFAFGALLNKFVISQQEGSSLNVIRSYESPLDAQEHIAPLFYGAKLSPFACRLANAQFEFEQQEYHINKYFSGKSALHGLIYDQVFALTGENITAEAASIDLSYSYNKQEEGFPFAYAIKVSYTLAGNKLSVATSVTNCGENNMPVSDGWHPYFQLGGSLDEMEATFRSDAMVVFDDTLLPTGEMVPYSEFASFRSLNGVELDNSFTLKNSAEPALQLRNPKIGVQVNILPEASYPILQLYTPPERDSIAIENLSSIPDSFNNKQGLLVAAPEQTLTFETAYEVILL